MNILYQIYSELKESNILVTINHKETELIFKNCPFCSNPNWNLDVELTEKFVYSCWACGTSGTAVSLFQNIYNVLKHSTYLKLIEISNKIFKNPKYITSNTKDNKNLYKFHYIQRANLDDFFKILKKNNLENKYIKYYSLFKNLNKLSNWKFFINTNVIYKNIKVEYGLISLGLLQNGFLIHDFKNDFIFKTKSDIFYYSYNFNKINELYIVEGIYDVYPFLLKKDVLILTQTILSDKYLVYLKENLDLKIINLCLDKNAYYPLLKKIKELFNNMQINIFESNRHSPKDSDIMILKKSFTI